MHNSDPVCGRRVCGLACHPRPPHSLAAAFILPPANASHLSSPHVSVSRASSSLACDRLPTWRSSSSSSSSSPPHFSQHSIVKRRRRALFGHGDGYGDACVAKSAFTPTTTTRKATTTTATRMSGGNVSGDEQSEWIEALEGILVEALCTYYQGSPLFSEAEFNTLRDELEHLGLSQLRLYNAEKIWVQATSARDFDRRICQEFDLSEDDLRVLKHRLLLKGAASRPSIPRTRASAPPSPSSPSSVYATSSGSGSGTGIGTGTSSSNSSKRNNTTNRQKALSLQGSEATSSEKGREGEDGEGEKPFLTDADELTAVENVNERIKWFLFSDASEERFKIMLLYLPAVVMSFVTASVLTTLFALLDGEMTITVTNAGRFRLGILSYVAVMATFWISNRFTPTVLDYLDLGQPCLMRAACPICGAPVSCLFTGAARVRDERKCGVCGATVAFNRRWRKTYLVSPPGRPVQSPD